MRNTRTFLLVILIVGFAAFFYLLGGARNPKGQGKVVPLQSDEDVKIDGLKFSEWSGERRIWVLDAKKGKFNHKDNKANFQGVEVVFSPPEGGWMEMQARELVYDSITGDMIAKGDVEGESNKGYRFFTEGLFYYAEQRIVNTEDKVTLKKDRLILEGIGMKGFLEHNRFELFSSVRAVFSPMGAEP